MATQTTQPTNAAQVATKRERGLTDRWKARRAEHKQARLIGARNRRVLARWLRRTANRYQPPRVLTRTHEPLLHYRAAAVRTDLLELAAMLEYAQSPDPACVAAIHQLLADGCESPLYNANIHISELYATLHYIRSRI